MAKDKRGRVTPAKGSPPPSAPRERRSLLPKRVGPFARPEGDAPLGQVGRRPSNPVMLAVYAVVYLGCGVASFFVLSGSLGVIVGIVLVGLSLLWVRGAATAYLRQRG